MNTTAIGQAAEDIVAGHLEENGFQIISHNWKTPRCEIDLIARKRGVMYFVEVKYRRTSEQGDGFAYITPLKLRRMHMAADLWAISHGWRGEYVLAVASVAGNQDNQVDLIEL